MLLVKEVLFCLIWKKAFNHFVQLTIVSVIMITYNHEKFISQAIEGILNQKGNFDLELVIGNDSSVDQSNDICRHYSATDSRIKYYFHEKNLGANRNFKFCLDRAKGDYCAICEGDDYWVDEYKLKKQIEYLENNRDFSICFHDVYELRQGKLSPNSIKYSQDTFTIYDLSKGNFMHTPSILFRNYGQNILPAYFEKMHVGDYVLHMHLAKQGKIKLLPDKMAVYRIHENGSWSSKDNLFINRNVAEYLECLIEGEFDYKVKTILKKRLKGVYTYLYQFSKEKIFMKKIAKIDALLAIKILIKSLLHAVSQYRNAGIQ